MVKGLTLTGTEKKIEVSGGLHVFVMNFSTDTELLVSKTPNAVKGKEGTYVIAPKTGIMVQDACTMGTIEGVSDYRGELYAKGNGYAQFVPTNSLNFSVVGGGGDSSSPTPVIENPLHIKGIVATVEDLPDTGEVGDMYFVGNPDTDEDLAEYVYIGNKFEKLGTVSKDKDLVGILGKLVETVGYEHNNYVAPNGVTFANYKTFSYEEEIEPNLIIMANGEQTNLYSRGELTDALAVTHFVNSNINIDSNVEEMYLIADYDVTSDTTATEAEVGMTYVVSEDGEEMLEFLSLPLDLTEKGEGNRVGIKLPENAIGVEENVVTLGVNGTGEFDITLRLNLIKVPKGTEINYDTYKWRTPTWNVISSLNSIVSYMNDDLPSEIVDIVEANLGPRLKDLRDDVDNLIDDVKDKVGFDDLATSSKTGVVKAGGGLAMGITSGVPNGNLYINKATDVQIENGTELYRPIVPSNLGKAMSVYGIKNKDYIKNNLVGVNLLPYPYYNNSPYDKQGITYTFTDGELSISGTANNVDNSLNFHYDNKLARLLPVKATKYILHVEGTNVPDDTIEIWTRFAKDDDTYDFFAETVTNGKAKIIIDNTDEVYKYIRTIGLNVKSDKTVNVTGIKIQLEEGDTPHSYRPYTINNQLEEIRESMGEKGTTLERVQNTTRVITAPEKSTFASVSKIEGKTEKIENLWTLGHISLEAYKMIYESFRLSEGTYTIKATKPCTINMGFRNASDTTRIKVSDSPKTFTLTSPCTILDAVTETEVDADIMLEKGTISHEYIPTSILNNAIVNKLTSEPQYKNVFDGKYYFEYPDSTDGLWTTANSSFSVKVPVEEGKTYYVVKPNKDGNRFRLWMYADRPELGMSGIRKLADSNTRYEATVTVEEGEKYIGLFVSSGSSLIKPDIYVGELPYEEYIAQYYKKELMLSPEILNLPDYGCSAGNVSNVVDIENMKYYHNVGSVDLGTLSVLTTSTADLYNCQPLPVAGKTGTVNMIINKPYVAVSSNTEYTETDKSIRIASNGTTLGVHDSEYVDGALNGCTLVYELATPEVIDLKTIIPPIAVTPNGTLTFNNEHNLDIPTEVIYKKEG